MKGNVVDIGCGRAKYRTMILGFPGVRSYTGVDLHPYRDKSVNSDITADLNGPLPIGDARYDSAICISVIEHLKEPYLAISEMHRILKSGGYLLLSAPWMHPYHEEPEDYYRFSKGALEYLLTKAGFEIEHVSSTGGKLSVIITFMFWWLPFTRKFQRYVEQAAIRFNSQQSNESHPKENTSAYEIVARKK